MVDAGINVNPDCANVTDAVSKTRGGGDGEWDLFTASVDFSSC